MRHSLDVINRQRKACLLVAFIKRARGVRLYRVFIEATYRISRQSDTGPSVYNYGLDAVIVRITT